MLTELEMIEMIKFIEKPLSGVDIQQAGSIESARADNKAEAIRAAEMVVKFFEKKRVES